MLGNSTMPNIPRTPTMLPATRKKEIRQRSSEMQPNQHRHCGAKEEQQEHEIHHKKQQMLQAGITALDHAVKTEGIRLTKLFTTWKMPRRCRKHENATVEYKQYRNTQQRERDTRQKKRKDAAQRAIWKHPTNAIFAIGTSI